MTALVSAPTDPSRTRLAICAAALAACLPYALLKIAWIAGSDIGITDAESADVIHSTEYRIGNALTLGLELGAVAIVLALTFARRPPPLLVVGPIWIGTGLLAPFCVGLPIGLAAQAVAGGSPSPDDGGLHGWVFVLVYGGFIIQAPLLIAAFALHVRARWRWVSQLTADDVVPGPTYALQLLMARTGLVVATLIAMVQVLWAIDPETFAGPAAFDTVAQRTFLLVGGVFPLAGAIGTLALVRRNRTGSLFAPLAAAWTGSAAAFVSILLPTADTGRVETFVNGVSSLTGLGLAVTGLLVLIDARPSTD